MVVTEQYCVIFYYYTDLELNAPPAHLLVRFSRDVRALVPRNAQRTPGTAVLGNAR